MPDPIILKFTIHQKVAFCVAEIKNSLEMCFKLLVV